MKEQNKKLMKLNELRRMKAGKESKEVGLSLVICITSPSAYGFFLVFFCYLDWALLNILLLQVKEDKKPDSDREKPHKTKDTDKKDKPKHGKRSSDGKVKSSPIQTSSPTKTSPPEIDPLNALTTKVNNRQVFGLLGGRKGAFVRYTHTDAYAFPEDVLQKAVWV